MGEVTGYLFDLMSEVCVSWEDHAGDGMRLRWGECYVRFST